MSRGAKNMMKFVLECDPLWIGDGAAHRGHVVVRDGRIAAVKRGSYRGPLPTTRLEGLSLSPGMIDAMFGGGFGESALSGDLARLSREYLRLGVTSFQVCSGNAPWDAYEKTAANLRGAMKRDRGDQARVLGLYSEGPFIQPESAGGNLAGLCQPATRENVRRFLEIFGETLTMINISPQIDGDLEAIAQCRAAGKVVAMCHSNASAEHALKCIAAGTSVLGHAFDNNKGLSGDSGLMMPTIEHAALLDSRLRFIHLICDGIHVHPFWVRLALVCRGVGSLCLVTDTLACAGGEDRDYVYEDGQTFRKAGGVARDKGGRLFGSALLLPDHLRNFIRITGINPSEAIRTVTFNPAASLGLEKRLGRLAPGCAADLVGWDAQMRVRRVWRAGVELAELSGLQEVNLG